MDEIAWEQQNLSFGTAKRKGDLLSKTELSPNKLRHAIKKFGEPIPQSGLEAEAYVSDLFDYLLDFDLEYYEKFPEKQLLSDLTAYVKHEIWLVKLKNRTIQDNRCAVAMDLRKCLKDHAANIAQITGRVMKNMADELPAPRKQELRELFMDSADEVAELAFGGPLRKIKLLN